MAKRKRLGEIRRSPEKVAARGHGRRHLTLEVDVRRDGHGYLARACVGRKRTSRCRAGGGASPTSAIRGAVASLLPHLK